MATADFEDLFSQLLGMSWKGVSFPASTFDLKIRHDLAQHKYPDRDGANVEETGRAPLQFSARMPFCNGVSPGKAESFTELYPTQYRAFIAAASVGTTGILQHPEFGQITCKLESCDTVWDANLRDGVIVTATWIETIISDDETSFTTSASPIGLVLLSAQDLDAQVNEIEFAAAPSTQASGGPQPAAPLLPAYTPDFAASMRAIAGAADQISILGAQGVGQIDAVAYRLGAIQDSVGNVFENNNQPSCLAWPILQTIQAMKSSLYDLKRTIGTTGRDISLYVVPADSSLAAISSDIGTSIDDVIVLNRTLLASPVVLRGTSVRYYTSDVVSSAA